MGHSKLRIAVWHNLPAGGARRSIVAHVRGLQGRGHHIEVWSPNSEERDDLMSFGKDIQQRTVPLAPHPLGLDSHFSRMRRFLTEQKQAVEAMKAHSKTAAEQMAGFDVLLATNCIQFHSPFIGRYFKGPKLLYLQEPKTKLYNAGERLVWRAPTPLPSGASLRSKIRAKILDYVAIRDARQLAELDYQNTSAYDQLLANSYFSRESILRAYNLDAKVCYLGIDSEMFKIDNVLKAHYVIGLGSITPNKNIEFILRSLATIEAPQRPKLIWIGQMADSEYHKKVVNLAKSFEVELDLRVRTPDEELVRLLAGATAFVYAPRLEPFGFAPLEANACGTVVISVPEGGMRESIVDGLNGFLVEPTAEAFGTKVKWLLSRPELAESMGRQAAEHVRSVWTWDKSVDLLEKHLFDIRGMESV